MRSDLSDTPQGDEYQVLGFAELFRQSLEAQLRDGPTALAPALTPFVGATRFASGRPLPPELLPGVSPPDLHGVTGPKPRNRHGRASNMLPFSLKWLEIVLYCIFAYLLQVFLAFSAILPDAAIRPKEISYEGDCDISSLQDMPLSSRVAIYLRIILVYPLLAIAGSYFTALLAVLWLRRNVGATPVWFQHLLSICGDLDGSGPEFQCAVADEMNLLYLLYLDANRQYLVGRQSEVVHIAHGPKTPKIRNINVWIMHGDGSMSQHTGRNRPVSVGGICIG